MTADVTNAPQKLEEMFNFVLDAGSKDQIGTLLVAVLVGLMATAARVAVKRQDRWWFNMLLVHGAIFAYWWNRCHLDVAELESPWLKTIHGGLCWKTATGDYQRILFWGGDTERWWLNVLVWLAVLGNVVPAYATGNEAARHMRHIKKKKCNPMIHHIIAGILCVCFPYFVYTYQMAVLIPVAMAFDIYHQITIHRLISNHDGIWALRAVSMSLAITKWIVVLNMGFGANADPWDMLDQLFVLSTGFLGTRAYGATALVFYWLGLGDIKTAEWYSIGLMTADVMIMGRLWGQMRIAFWLTIVNCAAMHFHQMWKKWLHLRPHFVGMTVVLTVIVAHSDSFISLLFTIVWCFSNFVLPHFNRFRPEPVTDMTPTVTPAYRLIREISGRISTRLGKLMSTRGSSRLMQSFDGANVSTHERRNSMVRLASLRRLSGFNKQSKMGSYNNLLSTRSNLMSPSNSIWEEEGEVELKNTLKQREDDLGVDRTLSMDSSASDYDLPKHANETPQWQYGQKRASAAKEPSPRTEEQFDELKAMILALQKQMEEGKRKEILLGRSDRSISSVSSLLSREASGPPAEGSPAPAAFSRASYEIPREKESAGDNEIQMPDLSSRSLSDGTLGRASRKPSPQTPRVA